jgi:K(+)-stimulated pyrophosphate-energized sodium pump
MLTAFISLWYAWMLRKVVLKKDKGTPNAGDLERHRIGADSYLKTQLRRSSPSSAS